MIDIQTGEIALTQEARSLIQAAFEAVFLHEGASGDVCVLLTDEDGIQTLNSTFRGMDSVTDVLTFPAHEGENPLPPSDGYLGDVALCLPRAEQQAAQYGHSLERELAFLSVHSALHLLGYDHMDRDEEKRMFALQETILTEMGVSKMPMLSEEEKKKMLELACEAMERSYSPYSRFRVGACLKASSGKYYLGCNIENAAYTPTICAERTAMFKAVFEGERAFDALAVVCSGKNPGFPCGVCRQVLSEFASSELPIVCMAGSGETVETTLGALLPHSFGPKDLL